MCGIIPPVIGRCGGIGRRPGLKIPWEEIPVPVRPRSSAPKFDIVRQSDVDFYLLPLHYSLFLKRCRFLESNR